MNQIQWYPGHMTRARRTIEKDIHLVDLVIEILDARIPFSTENPDIRKITEGKKRLILLNKSDLADPAVTDAWIRYLSRDGSAVIKLDARKRDALSSINIQIDRLMKDKRERDAARGITGARAVKAIVLGIPNVGKSTLINSIAGKVTAETGNKPGVTRGNQWINAGKELLLLDTPGVLWPRFEDKRTGFHLALIGSINDDILDPSDLAMYLADKLLKDHRDLLFYRYGITEHELSDAVEYTDGSIPGLNREALAILDLIAKKRNCVKKGSVPDYDRTAKLLIDDFRSGKIGHISLEKPQ